MQKPILIGMNNPLSPRPGYELFPAPRGCTGHRIFEMLAERVPGTLRQQYLDTFERRNLVVGQMWDRALGRQNAAEMSRELFGSGRMIVLFGQDVRRSFGHPELLLHPQMIDGCTWRQLPHPSGRNTWYNDAENRRLAGMVLEELYVEYHKGTTPCTLS
jgi:hypothetical protein